MPGNPFVDSWAALSPATQRASHSQKTFGSLPWGLGAETPIQHVPWSNTGVGRAGPGH